MGIEDRDYMRRREYPGPPPPHQSSTLPRRFIVAGIVAGALFIICGAIFFDSDPHSASEPQTVEKATTFHPVNINTASAQELDSIPYVSEEMAKAIIAHRPFEIGRAHV